MCKVSDPVFLLGAGFNRDARRHAGRIQGQSIYVGEFEIECGYPLAEDLACLCFGKVSLSNTETIEELFAEAIARGDWAPLNKLYHALMKADYYIVPRLVPNGTNPANPYARFFQRFRGCHFLTFNYDSLPEIFLLSLGAWFAHDGYGLPVKVDLSPAADREILSRRSKSYVLHLHGSLCIYPESYESKKEPGGTLEWLVRKETPSYVFDPDAISHLFLPYTRISAGNSYVTVENRVVAPVPNKATALQQDFIQAVRDRADPILESCSALVAIGYSFNKLDHASYEHTLDALSRSARPRVAVVCPDAALLSRRLTAEYPGIHWEPREATFEGWVDADFPGA